ncbi:hypothetical protein ABH927_005897 [Planotetraspora sp. GP83]
MGTQPRLKGVGATAGENVDALAGFGVGEDGGVSVAPFESEVIDPEHSGDPRWRQRQPHEQPQRGGPRDRDVQCL